MPLPSRASSASFISLLGAGCLLWGWAVIAQAQSRHPENANSASLLKACQQLPACQEHLDKADHFDEQQDYGAALQEYQAAYALRPYPLILFNIASLHRKQAHFEDAIRYYQRYLKSNDRDEGMRDKARQRIAEAKLALAPLPADAEQAAAAAAPALLAPGSLSPSSATPALEQHAAKPMYKKWWFWSLVGVVVAGGVAGTVGTLSGHAATPPASAAPLDIAIYRPTF